MAKRKAIDRFRRDRTLAAKYAQVGARLGPSALGDGAEDVAEPTAQEIDDDRLRLIFVACHPVLSVPGAGRARRCVSSVVSP